VLNLFIGVIVNAMSEATDEEAHNEREEILKELIPEVGDCDS
jgi:voltage-gated sodium channel